MSVGVGDGFLGLLVKARAHAVVLNTPLQLKWRRSCLVFLVISLSNYSDQVQQPRVKPYSCLELCTSARAESHDLFPFPIGAPHRALQSCPTPFPGRWVIRVSSHGSAFLLRKRESRIAAASRRGRACKTGSALRNKEAGLQEQHSQALLLWTNLPNE